LFVAASLKLSAYGRYIDQRRIKG